MASPPRYQLREYLLKVFDDIVSLLGTMGNPSRLRILITLLDAPQSYQNLKGVTRLKKSTLSSHLSLLQNRGLIKKLSHGSYDLTETGFRYLWLLAQFFEEPSDLEITHYRSRVAKGFLERRGGSNRVPG